MEDYAKSKMELAPRDIVSRAMITELAKGRGLLHEVSGMTHLLLDMRHIGEEKIDERLPMIKEISMKLLGHQPGARAAARCARRRTTRWAASTRTSRDR